MHSHEERGKIPIDDCNILRKVCDNRMWSTKHHRKL